MIEYLCTAKTLTDAYHQALVALHDLGEIADCTDWNCKQREISMTMVVLKPLAEPMISKCFIGGPRELQQYCMEMLDGILDFEIDKGNWSYTYHDRMVNFEHSLNQIDFIVSELKRNPSSRRAVMIIRDPSVDIKNNDPACLQHIQYFIRNGKLDCQILFRSNDACKATFMNAFALILLQKRIADILGIPVGTYTHRANSFHCYEKDFDLLEGYVKRIFSNKEITYNYNEDWKDLMEEYVPLILSDVKKLKLR